MKIKRDIIDKLLCYLQSGETKKLTFCMFVHLKIRNVIETTKNKIHENRVRNRLKHSERFK